MKDDGKRWIFLNEIQGHIAMWAVRQSPYHNPDRLGDVLDLFRGLVEKHFDKNDMLKMTRGDLRQMLKRLRDIPLFLAWNERKNGNQSPYGFVSRYDRPSPDDDFIDLDALTNNVVRSVFTDADREHEEDSKFENPIKSLWRSIKWKLFPLPKSTPVNPPEIKAL